MTCFFFSKATIFDGGSLHETLRINKQVQKKEFKNLNHKGYRNEKTSSFSALIFIVILAISIGLAFAVVCRHS